MVSIGNSATLQVIKKVDFGLYLDGGEFGEILLPARYVPHDWEMGGWLDVFIYLDSEDIIIATTERPYVEVGQCAHLQCIDISASGAFLNWGLSKDLFCPFKEQRVRMEKGKSYTVCVFQDGSGRICASNKLDHFLYEEAEGKFVINQAVDLLIASRSELGYKAIINGTHLGLIHNNDILVPIRVGERMTGYIKHIRADDAIDLSLQQQGEEMRDLLLQQIIDDLKMSGGTSNLTDKSPADAIFQRYQVSKSNYKRAIGQLYKEQKIMLGKDRITLVK
jgi:predicted RNA-binding protein (virulence factor B family)